MTAQARHDRMIDEMDKAAADWKYALKLHKARIRRKSSRIRIKRAEWRMAEGPELAGLPALSSRATKRTKQSYRKVS